MKALPKNLQDRMEALNKLWEKESCKNTRILKCGFVSLELSLNQLAAQLRKRRDSNDFHSGIRNILHEIENQLTMLKGVKYANGFQRKDLLADTTFYSRNVACLNRLDTRYKEIIDRITQNYFGITQKIGLDIGLGTQMNNIRAAFFMAPIQAFSSKKLAYEKLVDLREVPGRWRDVA